MQIFLENHQEFQYKASSFPLYIIFLFQYPFGSMIWLFLTYTHTKALFLQELKLLSTSEN